MDPRRTPIKRDGGSKGLSKRQDWPRRSGLVENGRRNNAEVATSGFIALSELRNVHYRSGCAPPAPKGPLRRRLMLKERRPHQRRAKPRMVSAALPEMLSVLLRQQAPVLIPKCRRRGLLHFERRRIRRTELRLRGLIAKGIAKGRQNAEHNQAEPATAGSIGTSHRRRMIVVMRAMLSVEPKARDLPIMLLPHWASISITPTPQSATKLARSVFHEGRSPMTSQASAAVMKGMVA